MNWVSFHCGPGWTEHRGALYPGRWRHKASGYRERAHSTELCPVTETTSLREFQCVWGNINVCPTQTSLRVAHAVDRVLHALTFGFLLKDPNSCFLFRSQLHTNMGLQWQLLFFLCSLKAFFLRNSLYVLSSLCLLALCPKCTWLYPLYSYVYYWFIFSLIRFSVGPMHNVQKEQAVCMEERLDPQKGRQRLYGFLSWKHFCL